MKFRLNFCMYFYPDYDFKSGRVIRANRFKCGDLTVQPALYDVE